MLILTRKIPLGYSSLEASYVISNGRITIENELTEENRSNPPIKITGIGRDDEKSLREDDGIRSLFTVDPESDPDFKENYIPAFRGECDRWKLVACKVCSNKLALVFADTSDPDWCNTAVLYADDSSAGGNTAIYLDVDRPGNSTPDHYFIYFGWGDDGSKKAYYPCVEESRNGVKMKETYFEKDKNGEEYLLVTEYD